MKIKFLATGQAPAYYNFNGNVITAYKSDGSSESYDLSGFPEGAQFQGADPVVDVPAIRNIEFINGELHVTLCQQCGPGHWTESTFIDTSEYDPEAIQVIKVNKPHSGKPWVRTKLGKVEVK